jgi:transcriptional regulator with XRE-family HTH domain
MKKIVFDDDIYNTIRKERGLTSAQLAEMVDLSHDFIRQIESEKTRYNFSVETFYKISVALDVGLDRLAKR